MEHVLEVKNLVLGNLRFLALDLPHTWDIAPGVSRPEVTAGHERRSVRWVANGDFWYVLFHREHGWAMEVSGHMRPPGRPVLKAGEVISAGGHAASVRWKTGRRGPPWKRHDVRFMQVDFECAASERRIALEFSGWCPEQGFREVLQSLQQLKCH